MVVFRVEQADLAQSSDFIIHAHWGWGRHLAACLEGSWSEASLSGNLAQDFREEAKDKIRLLVGILNFSQQVDDQKRMKTSDY
jgi:hypothetical protein